VKDSKQVNQLVARAFVLGLVVALILLGGATATAVNPGDVIINEIMQNPSAVSDSAGEWIELFNRTGSSIDINGWTIVDNDIDSHVIDNGGPLMIPAGGFLVLGTNADMATNGGVWVNYSYGSGWYLGNSADEVVLLDSSLAEVDRVEYDGGPMFPDPNGASMALNNPASDNNVGANWSTSTTPFGAGDLGTPGAPNDEVSISDPLLNEFVHNHTGADTNEYVEVFGDPSTDYSAFTVLEVEGDSTGTGTIDGVFPIGTTDASGFWTTGFLNNQLENGTVTLLLVEGFSGSAGDDLDIDNDGALDATPWTRIVDDVTVFDGGLDDRAYSSVVLSPGFDGGSFMPGGASRIPNGTDTDSVNDWVRNDFDGVGLPSFVGTADSGEAINTPGAMNQEVAAPVEVIINELDSDTVSVDSLEFVELYDGGSGGTALNGLVVVFYNGNGTYSYAAYDLDGYTTDVNGYFVLGNSGVSPTPGIIFPDNTLQNGADAVALYAADAADFPNGTFITTENLIDAIVYDTSDGDNFDLLILLNAGQPQVDENSSGNKDNHSNQRCPNGSGGGRNTDSYIQNTPTPGAQNNCPPPVLSLTIMAIQGPGHKSPYEAQTVATQGIVTALRANGFYLQDPEGDGNIATSDGIFVFTSSAPSVAVGDSVTVKGVVSEYYPGGFSTGNLSTSELINPDVDIVSSGTPLPTATIIGSGGRIPPSQVIDDDAAGDVEITGSFDPTTDGIDFYESMEGMLVQVNQAVAVSPTNDFGEIAVVGDNGANSSLHAPRGGIVIQPGDFNPERIILDDVIIPLPNLSVGDRFTQPIVGVLDYSFGNFKLLPIGSVVTAPGGLSQETTSAPVAGQLSVASFNVENLDPLDGPAKFETLAGQIVNHLRAPDIIGLQEVQDNNGPTNDSVVDASLTYDSLIAAIQDAGGPVYEFRDIAPLDDQDGGEPGGNIRVGFLFRADRDLAIVDRPGGAAHTATSISVGTSGVELSFSPGRIDPTNPAFNNSRKPLVGEFVFDGVKIFVIVNHFISKSADTPLFGRIQPPVLNSEVQRLQQAQAVNDFVDGILTLDPNSNIIVIGDMNDFQFSAPLSALAGDVLTNLVTTLPIGEQYTYISDGNSQVLDNFLVSTNLANSPFTFDIVHTNSEFISAARPTDHDPLVGRFCLATTPVNADDDNDGMVDCWELHYFGKLDRDGTLDWDEDGLIDVAEFDNGTSPTDADTDGDRMEDGWEVANYLDPLVDDAHADADEDGSTNLLEYLRGTDPNDPNSYPSTAIPWIPLLLLDNYYGEH